MFAPRSGEKVDRVGHPLPTGPRLSPDQRILSGYLIFNALDAMRRQTPSATRINQRSRAPLGFAIDSKRGNRR
jgi:hypothetical protein